jgi:heme A synthase
MMETIQRIIGLAIGAIVAMILLVATTDVTLDQTIMPIVVGAVAAFFWPVVIGWWLVRRAKARREDQIQSEVSRQIDQQKRG